MYIKIEDSESCKYDVIDTITGVRIPLVQEADDEKGEFTIVLYDFCNQRFVIDANEDLIQFKIKRPISIVRKE